MEQAKTFTGIDSVIASPFTKHLDFDPQWHNGTGYFNKLAEDTTVLASGEIGYCEDEKGRRIVVQNTGIGNFVVFDRYDDGRPFLATHVPRLLEQFFPGSRISKEDVEHFFSILIKGKVTGGRLFHMVRDISTAYTENELKPFLTSME